jgi:hypothetical protein
MDPLERELRDLLTSDRGDLPASLVPLDRVHAGASRRRRRRAAVASAATAVVVLAVAGTAAGAGFLRGDEAPVADSTPTVSRSIVPAPVPTSTAPDTTINAPAGLPWDGKLALSVTATSARTFVVLGGVGGPCPTGCLRLAQSNDGGKTFTALPLPAEIGQTGTLPTQDGVQSVRFGSGDDGWLFGGDLWSSHDGGYSWKQLSLPGPVVRLEAAAGSAWALVGSGKNDDRLHLWTSSVSADDWSRVLDVSVTGPADLAVQGKRVVVLGAQDSRLWVGGTAGFAEHPSPCPGATSVRLSSVGSIWATCGTGMSAALHVSADGVLWSNVPVSETGALPNSIMVGARTDGDAIVALGPENPLQRLSSDGTLSALGSAPPSNSGFYYLGFTNPSVGYAVAGADLWRTEDGGDTWHKLTLG